jgi:hypothetical protein
LTTTKKTIYINGVETKEGVEMKKGGIGGAIKGFFFESSNADDEDDGDIVEAQESKVSSKSTQSTANAVPVASSPVPELKINQDIVNSIKDCMDENKLEGYNYYEFMQAVEEQTDIPSEQKKYEIVFKVVKGMGVTKQTLVSTADHYSKVVEKHKQVFIDKVASEEASKVVNVRTEAENIEKSISAKMAQMDALKQEIDSLHGKKVEALNVAHTNEMELMQIKQEGELAYKLFLDQIKDGKTKINQYLS